MLTQEQLAFLRFPLGELRKEEARAIADEAGLVNARKHESQDICFIPDSDYGAFLERRTGRRAPEGDILDLSGRVIGRHRGAVRYTIGQRRGLGVAAEQPLYVAATDERDIFMTLDQLLLRQLYIRKLPLTRYCRSNNCHAFRLPRKGREKRHFNHLINAALQSSVYGHFIAALIKL